MDELIERFEALEASTNERLATIERITLLVAKSNLLAAKTTLTLEDVAALTGLSKSHLYKLTSTHQIPYYKPSGKMMYFDRGEIEAWMKQNRMNTIDEAEQQAVAYIFNKER